MGLKRILTAIFFLLGAHGVFGGVAYRFTTVTTGFGAQQISGDVEAEGPRMRLNVASGDGTTYPTGSFVLVDGNRVSVCVPATKTYYDLVVDPLAPMKSMFGDAASVSNERVSNRDLGGGHRITTTSYDLNVAILDKKMTMRVVMTNETWNTDRYPAWASIAKVLNSDPRLSTGGFPLKQVTNYRIEQNGQPIEVTSTTTVSNVVTKAIPATDLAMPAGYRKVESPIDSALKSLGR